MTAKAIKSLVALMPILFVSMATIPEVADAASCAIDPTKGAGGMAATSRYGTFRSYYNGGKGGGHQGQDLRSKAGTPLYAPFDGTVVFKGNIGAGGNALALKNSEGHVVWFMHLSGFSDAISNGTKKFSAGDMVALSGGTPGAPGAGRSTGAHLHMEYTVPKREDAKNKVVKKGMSREAVFKLENVYSQKSNKLYVTDPAGYMCDAYTFVGGAAVDNAVLGKNTKEQYQILYGNVPNGVAPDFEYSDTQVVAANSVAIQANAAGQTIPDFLSDRDGFGALPGIKFAEYEKMSPSEMISRESKRRMNDAEWQKNLTIVSSRALWVDYLQTIAIGNYMQEAIYRKKEKIEGLLAALVTQEAAPQRIKVDDARQRAVKHQSVNNIK